MKIWETSTGTCVSTLTVDSAVCSVAFCPDGSKIAAAYSKEIQIFDVKTKAKLWAPLSGHSGYPTAVSYSCMFSKIFGAKTKAKLGSPLSGHSGCATAVSYSCLFSNVWCVLTIEHFTGMSGVFALLQTANNLLVEARTTPSRYGRRRLARACRR